MHYRLNSIYEEKRNVQKLFIRSKFIKQQQKEKNYTKINNNNNKTPIKLFRRNSVWRCDTKYNGVAQPTSNKLLFS